MGCMESQQNQTAQTNIGNQRQNQSRQNAIRRAKKKKEEKPYVSRLSSKFKQEDINIISDQDRRSGYQPCYVCPICCVYFDKILSCSDCKNCICLSCFNQYEKKWKKLMKCSFCYSTTSLFTDYELEAHSYFDASNNGFLSPDERKKIDEQLKLASGIKQRSKLELIREEQVPQ